MDWIHPWIGLDWVGSDDCYVGLQNYDGLCFFSAKQTETIQFTLLFFYFLVLTNIDYLHCHGFICFAINMQH